MGFTALSLGFIAGLNLWIGSYVYSRNSRAPANRAFGFMAAAISAWTMALAFAHFGSLANTWALRGAFAAGSLIPIAVLVFVESFPGGPRSHRKVRRYVFTPLAIVLLTLSLTPLVVVSLIPGVGQSKATYGAAHPVFAAYALACFGYSMYSLAAKYKEATGRLKLQLRHLIFALAAPIALATSTNLMVPLFLNTSSLSKYGPFFSLLFLALIGHAIIRHRLMDIRVVIKRGAVYLAAFLVAGIILSTLLLASTLVFPDERYFSPVEIVIALTVAVLFYPLKLRIQRAFDRYLYREPYDYPRIVRETSRALGDTIDLGALLTCVGGVIQETLKPEGTAVYLLEEDGVCFERTWVTGSLGFPSALTVTSPIGATLAAQRASIFRDDLAIRELEGRAAELATDLDRVGAEVVVPLIEEDRLIGFFALGPKSSGNPYFSDDADLLVTLANQSAVAIRNAQTHQRVVQVNEEIQKILSTIESGVIAVGAKGRVTLFNRAAEQLTGVPAPSVRGRPVEHLPATLGGLLAATAADGQPHSQIEFTLPDAAGQLVPLVCSTSPLLNMRGDPAGAVAVVSDLSRLKELEQERRRAERLASLEAIAAGMVHEIRNPLVAIKTFFQLLPVRFADVGFRESFGRVAGREIGRIDELLTRFRTLASASSQPMELVDVLKPIEEVLDLLGPQMDEHQIRLRRVADGVPRPVLANASQLNQIFLNLCLNAVEAMAPGGELTVRIADLSEGSGTTLLVEVSDTGSGIPEELLGTMFNPFVTTKPRGSGLGLAICRSIADAHHARLTARNNIGRPGSTFTIEFPVPVAGPARVGT